MDYTELKQLKETLDKYKITDLKQLDSLLVKALQEYKTKLEEEVAELQTKVDAVHLIEIPEGASEEVAMLVAQANEFPTGEKFMFETRLREKQDLLNELKAL